MIKLYKKDSKGNIRFLEINAVNGTIIQISGIVGTENPVSNTSQCVGKNIGKSNETTPKEQARLEVFSKVEEKLRLGYFYLIEDAKSLGGKDFLLPMLAKDAKKMIDKVKYPCYIQPKLDGMRSLNEDNSFTSRTGKAIETLSHINVNNKGYVIDGELYAHGISFQENMKLIKKYRKGETEKVKYHVYDLVSDLPFIERSNILMELFKDSEDVELVPTFRIKSREELKVAHSNFILQGYEGTIIRHTEAGYEVNKRSSSLLKYKDFLDATYVVENIIPSESRPEQGIVSCYCQKTKSTFQTGMKFSHKEREEILTNKDKYIGQMAEIRFFEFTDGGIPRFPVCVGFRLDK